jgi:TatD DNase family protein
MTDAHCHVSCGDPAVRELLVGRNFFGVHPWETLGETTGTCEIGEACETGAGHSSLACPASHQLIASLRAALLANPSAGVGEIGLDRLKCRDISPRMREVFETQLALAIELKRPVVLHGAKCWGQVVATVRALNSRQPLTQTIKQSNNQTLPPFLFHGFSRSDGLIPDIVKLNGYISVGPAVLNDHAVNYRELVKKIPLDRLLVETDRTEANAADCPPVRDVLAKVAELRGISAAELEKITDENVEKFFGASL